MSEHAPFYELTFLTEQILFEEVADPDMHQRCKVAGDKFEKSPIGYPASAMLCNALRLVVGHRLNHDPITARAWETIAGALAPLAKRERAEEIARLERRRAIA